MFAPKFTINTSHRPFTIKHTDRDKGGGGPFSTSVPDFFSLQANVGAVIQLVFLHLVADIRCF